MDISVDSKIIVKIGEQEVVLSNDEAEALYSGLCNALNKSNSPIVHGGLTWGTIDCTNTHQSKSTNFSENNG